MKPILSKSWSDVNILQKYFVEVRPLVPNIFHVVLFVLSASCIYQHTSTPSQARTLKLPMVVTHTYIIKTLPPPSPTMQIDDNYLYFYNLLGTVQ